MSAQFFYILLLNYYTYKFGTVKIQVEPIFYSGRLSDFVRVSKHLAATNIATISFSIRKILMKMQASTASTQQFFIKRISFLRYTY